MRKTLINSQMTSLRTYLSYRRQLVALAENVFLFRDLPELIDKRYMNETLLLNGAIAFFYDDELESVLALPSKSILKKDLYGRPTEIIVKGENNYNRILKRGEFIMMYDNNSYGSIYSDILQYAERIAMCEKVCDINISQMKTPRIWRTSQSQQQALKDLVNQVDGDVEKIMGYKNLDMSELTCIMEPAPVVFDKIDDHMEKKWAEFYRLIGVASLIQQKKERVISDEIATSQGGTVASRFSRYEPRLNAIEQINKKWGLNISLCYYDGTPCSNDEPLTIVKESESDNYVSMDESSILSETSN